VSFSIKIDKEKDHPEQSEWVFRSDGIFIQELLGGVKPFRGFAPLLK
jgi:hypothetical protein